MDKNLERREEEREDFDSNISALFLPCLAEEKTG